MISGCDSYLPLLNNGENVACVYKKDNIEFSINSYVFNNSLFVSVEYSDKLNIEKNSIKVFINSIEKNTYKYGDIITLNEKNMKKIILSVDHDYQSKIDTVKINIDGFDVKNCCFY